MTKKNLLQLLIGFLTIVPLVAGCTSQDRPDTEADASAINDIWTEYASRLNDGDIDRWISLWTEEGVQLPPNAPPVIGKDRIRVGMKRALDQFTFNIEITNAEVEVVGNWAFSRGAFTRTDTPKEGGQPVFFDGKYMTILERQADDSWKIHRDIFNSNVASGGE